MPITELSPPCTESNRHWSKFTSAAKWLRTCPSQLHATVLPSHYPSCSLLLLPSAPLVNWERQNRWTSLDYRPCSTVILIIWAFEQVHQGSESKCSRTFTFFETRVSLDQWRSGFYLLMTHRPMHLTETFHEMPRSALSQITSFFIQMIGKFLQNLLHRKRWAIIAQSQRSCSRPYRQEALYVFV